MAKKRTSFTLDTKDFEKFLKDNYTFAKREKALERAMRRTLEPIRKAMNAGAPVNYGILSKSHRTSKKRGGIDAGKLVLATGPSSGLGRFEGSRQKLAGWRAHFIEFGTKNHTGTKYLKKAIDAFWGGLETKLALELKKEHKKMVRKRN